MQYELIFRGSLIEYWQVAHAEWESYSHGDIHVSSPLAISHPFKDRPPVEFEEVVLEFLDDYFRRAPKPPPAPVQGMTWAKGPVWVFPLKPVHVPVTVRARSGSDGTLVSLTVHIEQEAYEESGKSALSRWNEIKNAWLKKGCLIDPLAQVQQPVSGSNSGNDSASLLIDPLAQVQQSVDKPEKPAKPKSGSSLELWFDWYHAMHTAGYATVLKEIAQETGYSHGVIKQKHALYMKEKGLAKPFKSKRHNQK